MLGFLASGAEEFNLGPVMRLDHSELLCNKSFVKYKQEKASDTDIRKGAERLPPGSFLAGYCIATSRLLIRERKCLKTQSGTRPLTLNMHFEITLAQGKSSRAIK